MPSSVATIRLTSVPSGATVRVDGRSRGQTPLSLSVADGMHHVLVRHPGAISASYTLPAIAEHGVRLPVRLWQSVPITEPLQPPFPGTAIVGADFLADGAVVLLAKPLTGGGFSLWRRQSDGSLGRRGPVSASGPIAARPNGDGVAYLAPKAAAAGGSTAPTTLWTASGAGDDAALRYALPPARPGEQLTDLSWSPDGAYLLVTAHRALSSGARDRLLRLDFRAGTAQPVVDLPTAIVPGSLTWGPGGTTVALLTQTGPLVSLCLVEMRTGAVRYLADLGQRDPAALPYPPVAWSPDGRQIVYAVGAHTRAAGLGGLLLGEQTVDRLFVADAEAGEGRQLDAAPALAPVWRDDGDIVAFARQKDGALALDQFTLPRGRTPAVGELPETPASPFAVRWDPTHGRALLVQHADTGLAGWLLSFETAGR